MARRRKGNSKSLLTVLMILVVIVVGINFGKNWIVKMAVEKSATAALQVPVTIESLNIGFLSGEASFKGLQIGNPSGFESPYLLYLANGDVRFLLSSLTEPAMVVNLVRLQGLNVYFEISPKGSNLQSILKPLGRKNAAVEANVKGPDKPGREWIIRDLQLTDASASPNLHIGGETVGRRIQIADIHLRDVGKEGKTVTTSEALQIILATITKNVSEKLPNTMIEQGLGNIGKGIKDIGKGILGK